VQNASDPDGDPLQYEFRVCTDAAMTKQVEHASSVPQGDTYTTYTSSQGLETYKPYFWNARASDGSATGEWSNVRSFILLGIALDNEAGFEALHPMDGITASESNPQLSARWQQSGATDTCHFEIATDEGFADLLDAGEVVSNAGEAQWTTNRSLSNDKLYFWRARLNGGSYSEPRTLQVQSSIFVSPNPFMYEQDHLVFHNLPRGSTLEVYNAAGDRINRFENLEGDFAWDGRNSTGEKLASGVYLYYVHTADDQTIGDKFIVVR